MTWHFTQFAASDFDADQLALVDQLAAPYRSFFNNLSLQMMVLEERDVPGFLSGESRVDESSQRFVSCAETF